MTKILTQQAIRLSLSKVQPDLMSEGVTDMSKQRSNRATKRVPRVTVLVGTATEWGRQSIRGIISVPDDVAVLAGDNDDLIAQSTIPPMSAVLNPCFQIGYSAAKLLDQQMNGLVGGETVQLIPPIEIVTRQSTDVFAFQNPRVETVSE